jgi:hypothetical protein
MFAPRSRQERAYRDRRLRYAKHAKTLPGHFEGLKPDDSLILRRLTSQFERGRDRSAFHCRCVG